MHPTDRDRRMHEADEDEARKREARERVERQCPEETCEKCGRTATMYRGLCNSCFWEESPTDPVAASSERIMADFSRMMDMALGPVAAKADHIPDLTKMVSPETCTRCGREALTVGGHCGRCIRQIAVGEPPTLSVCRKCLTLRPNATGLCDGCASDLVRECPPVREDFPDREGDFDEEADE